MIVVFVGPTISAANAISILDANYLPPARQGDIYKISLKRPDVIVLIDGYFDKEPAVCHKELLWAMSQGIHVFGCSSMGALRAAELYKFGMKGHGSIFNDYLQGIIEDDDEVALVHAAAEDGYKPLSEPMVNIRNTFTKALNDGLLNSELYDQLNDIAKKSFYPNRRYTYILDEALKNGADVKTIDSLKQWVRLNSVDQKMIDAASLLKFINDNNEDLKKQFKCNFFFEHTQVWNDLTNWSNNHRSNDLLSSLAPDLRENNKPDNGIINFSIHRTLKINEANRLGFCVTKDMLYDQILRFRRKKNLSAQNSLNFWLEENALTLKEFFILMEEEAKCFWIEELIRKEISANYSVHSKNYSILEGNSTLQQS